MPLRLETDVRIINGSSEWRPITTLIDGRLYACLTPRDKGLGTFLCGKPQKRERSPRCAKVFAALVGMRADGIRVVKIQQKQSQEVASESPPAMIGDSPPIERYKRHKNLATEGEVIEITLPAFAPLAGGAVEAINARFVSSCDHEIPVTVELTAQTMTYVCALHEHLGYVAEDVVEVAEDLPRCIHHLRRRQMYQVRYTMVNAEGVSRPCTSHHSYGKKCSRDAALKKAMGFMEDGLTRYEEVTVGGDVVVDEGEQNRSASSDQNASDRDTA